jgi:hypothetical protein
MPPHSPYPLELTIHTLSQQQWPLDPIRNCRRPTTVLDNMDLFLRRRHRHRVHHLHRSLPNKLDNHHAGNHHYRLYYLSAPTTMPVHGNGVRIHNDMHTVIDMYWRNVRAYLSLHTVNDMYWRNVRACLGLPNDILMLCRRRNVRAHEDVHTDTELHWRDVCARDDLLYCCGHRMRRSPNN